LSFPRNAAAKKLQFGHVRLMPPGPAQLVGTDQLLTDHARRAWVEARSGNVVGAENYYQHAERYFRLMSSTREAT
jgi:hypothetical protein